MEILLIEDEVKLLNSVSEGLKAHSFDVDIASDGLTGLNLALSKNYHVIISDIKMPQLDGYDLVKNLRNAGIHTPIILLSALDRVDHKIKGFDIGADDYLTKPFDFRELVSRVKALSKRNNKLNIEEDSVLRYGDIEANEANRNVKRGQKRIELTPKEFDLLVYFMKNPDRVITKSELMSHIWDIDFNSGTNVIEVYVNFLRNKIDKDFDEKYIHTRFRIGYIFRKEN